MCLKNSQLTRKTTHPPFHFDDYFLLSMKTPYEILGIATNADDNKIKQAYLLKVKDNPPDREQKQFQIIRNAYESIKDEKRRVSYDLFTLPIANFDKLIDQALEPQEKIQLNADHFNKLLFVSIDDTTFQNAIPTPKK